MWVYFWIEQHTPAEFTNWDADVESTVTAELWGDIDVAIFNLFWETFYTALDDDIGGWSPLVELWWIYDTILKSSNEWYWLQISDWWDMDDTYIEPYSDWQWATDAVCIVWDNDDWGDVEYLVWTANGDWFDFQLSSLATHFSGKDTVCMFIFKV